MIPCESSSESSVGKEAWDCGKGSQEEVWDMCVRSETKTDVIKTMIEDSKYFGASKQDTVLRLREKFNMTQNQADEVIKEYW